MRRAAIASWRSRWAALVAAEVAHAAARRPRRAAPRPRCPPRRSIAPRATLAALKADRRRGLLGQLCGPRRKEAPQISRLAASLHGRAQLVASTTATPPSGARAFIRSTTGRSLTCATARGAGERYGLGGLPDDVRAPTARAAIVKRFAGPQSAATLLAAVQGLKSSTA